MTKIKKLSEKTINQIAAGEVVESATSVVKELVENAIDAGASIIKVEIMAGGRDLIRITDNGCGMTLEDLALSVQRHATSKLDEENINCITSLGFRGEALPSIGSIANVTITTRTEDADCASKIELRGGVISEITPAAGNVGTVIEVQDLFSYTPVRLKFMKTEATEKANILLLLQHFALCYPGIHFTLVNNGEVMATFLPTVDPTKRMEIVLGTNFARNMLPIDKDNGEIAITGFIGLPTFAGRSAVNQYIFVNGRAVKDKHIYVSLKAAYANIMEAKGHPAAILHINLDPYEVDVNVHPAKTEVRFRDQARIRAFLISGIRATLRDARPQTASTLEEKLLQIPQKPLELKDSVNMVKIPTLRMASVAQRQPTVSPMIMPQQEMPRVVPQESAESLGDAVCQIDNTYIIAKSPTGLVIVDQHAAHERLVLEAMRQQGGGIQSQRLLIPDIIDLGEVLVEHIMRYKEKLQGYGIELERYGITQVLIHQVPTLIAIDEVRQLLKELAEMIAIDGDDNIFENKREEVLGRIACHSSIRAGRALNIKEMNMILRQIESTPLASQCNHGRPTFIRLSSEHLAKKFSR